MDSDGRTLEELDELLAQYTQQLYELEDSTSMWAVERRRQLQHEIDELKLRYQKLTVDGASDTSPGMSNNAPEDPYPPPHPSSSFPSRPWGVVEEQQGRQQWAQSQFGQQQRPQHPYPYLPPPYESTTMSNRKRSMSNSSLFIGREAEHANKSVKLFGDVSLDHWGDNDVFGRDVISYSPRAQDQREQLLSDEEYARRLQDEADQGRQEEIRRNAELLKQDEELARKMEEEEKLLVGREINYRNQLQGQFSRDSPLNVGNSRQPKDEFKDYQGDGPESPGAHSETLEITNYPKTEDSKPNDIIKKEEEALSPWGLGGVDIWTDGTNQSINSIYGLNPPLNPWLTTIAGGHQPRIQNFMETWDIEVRPDICNAYQPQSTMQHLGLALSLSDNSAAVDQDHLQGQDNQFTPNVNLEFPPMNNTPHLDPPFGEPSLALQSLPVPDLTKLQDPVQQAAASFSPYSGLIDRGIPQYNEVNNGWPVPGAGSSYADYLRADPTKTMEEIKALLENIRPDMDIPPENREGTPEALVYPLLEHQKLGLAWMKAMEEGSNKGGILADDMGLGKTIQALALMVSRPSNDKKCKTTLIIAPLSLLKQWEREIQKKLKPNYALSIYTHHGTTKKYKSFKELSKFDVVLTTFGTIAAEYRRKIVWMENYNDNPDRREQQDEFIFTGKGSVWYRVIIDEAQCIKNRDTLGAKGCAELSATYRFCLSGTPMQNRCEEIYSLIRFLQIKPYNDWTKFNRDFSRPFKAKNSTNRLMRDSMQKFQALLKAFLLRRTKFSQIDGKPILTLPPKTIEIVHSVFSDDEQSFYEALQSKTLIQFNKYLRANSIGKNYSNILVLLLRMRQACCHPHLINDIEINGEVAEDDMVLLAKELPAAAVARLKESGIEECPICMDTSNNPSIIIPCGHEFCTDCIVQVYNTAVQHNLARGDEDGGARCPGCRGALNIKKMIDWNTFKKVHLKDEAEEEDIPEADKKAALTADALAKLRKDARRNAASKREYLEYLEANWMPSAKITKCLEILDGIIANDPKEKTIIFSQWTSLLDLLEVPVFRKGWKYRRYDGTMNSSERNDAIIDFTDDPEIKIMLVSLKAGNSGLNLVAASQVILFDPCYNPFVEDQAIDRAHRIGQQRPVKVHKLSIKGTVEDRVLALQEEKKAIIESALDENASKGIARLGARDLAFLFGIDGAQLARIRN